MEINRLVDAGATITLDEDAAVQIVTWGDNQWVSYDNAETFKTKLDYANKLCLGGTLVWVSNAFSFPQFRIQQTSIGSLTILS